MNLIANRFIHFVVVVLGFFLLSGASSLLQYDKELVINFNTYIRSLLEIKDQFFHFFTLQFQWDENGRSFPLSQIYFHTFSYSFLLLLLSFLLSLLISVLLSYFIMMIPRRIQKFFVKMINIFDAFPDVFIVVLLQLFIIWLYKQTNILFFNIYTLGDDKIYFLPILCMAILPITYLVKQFLYQLEEEGEKPYVSFSYSKGLSKSYTLWFHLYRNVWIHFFNHSKPIFLLMLSNLLIIEMMFNINGFMKALLITAISSPPSFFIGMLFIYLPFYFIYSIGEIGINHWLKGAGLDE